MDGRVDKMFPFHEKPFSWLQSFVLKGAMSGSDSLHKISWEIILFGNLVKYNTGNMKTFILLF